MNLALVMFIKGLVLVAWAVFSEWKWPEEPESLPEIGESGTTTSARQQLLCLPAPEKPTNPTD